MRFVGLFDKLVVMGLIQKTILAVLALGVIWAASQVYKNDAPQPQVAYPTTSIPTQEPLQKEEVPKKVSEATTKPSLKAYSLRIYIAEGSSAKYYSRIKGYAKTILSELQSVMRRVDFNLQSSEEEPIGAFGTITVKVRLTESDIKTIAKQLVKIPSGIKFSMQIEPGTKTSNWDDAYEAHVEIENPNNVTGDKLEAIIDSQKKHLIEGVLQALEFERGRFVSR